MRTILGLFVTVTMYGNWEDPNLTATRGSVGGARSNWVGLKAEDTAGSLRTFVASLLGFSLRAAQA